MSEIEEICLARYDGVLTEDKHVKEVTKLLGANTNIDKANDESMSSNLHEVYL